ncbi:MFS transporter [Sphingomonas sp. SRS2]|uniref:MFS transporter n=1 Tax=Sphingomonas sp. SRS2 TaxID=133190 RepID=UPI0006184B43|nr:MFS transporter [Sphingomonas sp. SRS2]KKC24563.1 hypothetical protein WP12_18515 [Sphingomonas sp. SRS2]
MSRPAIAFPQLLAVLVIGELVCSLETNMIFVALAEVYRQTGDPARAAWLVTAFSLTAAGSAAIAGRFGDLYGRRRMLLIMLGVALIGSALSAVADSLYLVILGRALQGVSIATLPLSFGILREHARPEQLGFGVGFLGGTYTFSTGLGSLVGGLVIDHYHWQSIFAVSAVLAGVAFLLALLILPPSPGRPARSGRIDVLGGVLFAPAVAMLLLSLTFFRHMAWTDPLVWGPLLGGVVTLGVWVWLELHVETPLIDVRQLGTRDIGLANLATFVIGIGPMMISLVNIPLLQQARWSGAGFGLEASLVGAIWFLLCIVGGCAAIFGGYLSGRFGARTVVLGACLALALGWGTMFAGYRSAPVVIGVSVFLINPGIALLFAIMPAIIIEASPDDRISEATGLTQAVRYVGAAAGSVIVPYLLSAQMVSSPIPGGGSLPGAAGYEQVFVLLTLLSLIAALLIAMLPGRARSASRHPSSSVQRH